jgi:hypothetical protein
MLVYTNFIDTTISFLCIIKQNNDTNRNLASKE